MKVKMMNSFTGMECGAKWEWENMEMYDKLEITEWVNLEEEEENGSLNLSGSDFGNGSISASTNSSPKHGGLFKQSNLALEPFHYSFGEPHTVDLTVTSSTLDGSEPLMGLKLGKRTYFENCYGNAKSPSSVISGKRIKSIPLCAPILDLSSAKEYHRKHKVCDTQCNRFNSLVEFDDKKRSCGRRLSDHNARRRKPNQESFHFNSSTLPISYYDGRQRMSYGGGNGGNLDYATVYNNNNYSNPRFTITRASPSNPIKFEHGVAHMMGTQTQLPQVNGFVALKGGTSQIPVPCTIFSSTVDAAPEYRRALSLLSNDSYTSYEQQSSIVPYVMPYASAEHWPVGVQTSYRGSGGLLEQIPTYEEEFCHHLMN